MQPTYKTLLLGIICTLALGAGTASASAHEFIVAGNPIGRETDASGTGGTVKIVTFWASAEVQIECKSSTVEAGLDPSGKSSGEYRLEGCKTPGFPNCSVKNIAFTASGDLGGVKGALTDEIGLVSFKLSISAVGEKACTIKGQYPVEGTYTCALPGIETEGTEHEFACKGTLLMNGAKFTLTYSNNLRLTSGQKWSAA